MFYIFMVLVMCLIVSDPIGCFHEASDLMGQKLPFSLSQELNVRRKAVLEQHADKVFFKYCFSHNSFHFNIVFQQNHAICFYVRYRNAPKFSDGQVLANGADPDQTAPSLIRVYTVCDSVCIFCTHDTIVESHCLNFRISTAIFLVSEFLKVL